MSRVVVDGLSLTLEAIERAATNPETELALDPEALARDTPEMQKMQVYAMSLMGIDLDNQNEAQYLHQLASAMNLDQRTVNAIHNKFGAPELYRT